MYVTRFLVLLALVTVGCQSEVQLLRIVVRDNTDLSFDKLDGPQGGTVTSLVATADGVLFASVEFNGVYRSTDGGDTWTPSGFQKQNVWPLYATPGGGILAFIDAGFPGDDAVFRSNDHGETWLQIPDTVAAYRNTTVIRVSAAAMYTEGERGLHLSTDDGITWETLMDRPPGNWQGGQYNLEILSDSVMFCMHYNGLYRSDNGGRSWERRLPEYDCFLRLDMDSFGGIMVQARDTSIHTGWKGPLRLLRVSVDGVVKEVLSEPIWSSENHSTVVLQNGTMLGGSGIVPLGVYRSEDGGSTWQKTELHRGVITKFVQTADGTVFAATYGGILRSKDDGRTWEECCAGLPSLPVMHLFKSSQRRIYAGTTNGGLYSADDVADQWGAPQYGMCSVSTGFEFGSNLMIGTVPVLAQNIYDEIDGTPHYDFFFDGFGLVVSRDAGHNWEDINLGRRLPWRIVSGGGETVYSNAADLNISADGGRSWEHEPMLSEAHDLCSDKHGLFVIRGDSLHFKKQGEETWTTVLTAPRMRRVENTDSVLVVLTLDEILLRSTDLGETWKKTTVDEQWYLLSELTKQSPNMIAMTGWRERCLVSTDTGRSWTQFIPGTNRSAHVLSVLLDKEKYLLLGTREGLYRSRSPLDAMPVPIGFELGAPYPDSTDTRVLNIPYTLQRDGFVRLFLQDESGMDIAVHVEEQRRAGEYVERLSDPPAPGEYSVLLNVDGRVQRRHIVIK